MFTRPAELAEKLIEAGSDRGLTLKTLQEYWSPCSVLTTSCLCALK